MYYRLWKEALRTQILLMQPVMTQNRNNMGENPEKSDPGELSRRLIFLKGHVEKIERRFKIAVDWAL